MTTTTQYPVRKYSAIFTFMRNHLSSNPKAPGRDARFYMIYLHAKGMDWKRAVDVTSVKKLKYLKSLFQYNYYNWATKGIAGQADVEWYEIATIIHSEIDTLIKALETSS